MAQQPQPIKQRDIFDTGASEAPILHAEHSLTVRIQEEEESTPTHNPATSPS